MAWTEITRPKYARKTQRYQSDLTDAEWTLLAPLLRGQPLKWPLREIVNSILYLMRTGCQWRMLPGDFAPKSTVYYWFARWRDDATWPSVNNHLLMEARERCGREASPSAGAGRSTPSRSRPRKAVGPGAMTRVRRSKACAVSFRGLKSSMPTPDIPA